MERRKKEEEEKIEILPHFANTDFYKSTIHSRLTIFGKVYASRNFIKITTHHLHKEDFMPYLETSIAENPTYDQDTVLDNMRWKDLVMWRRFKTGKHRKDDDITVGLSRITYDYYLDFEK